MLLYVPEEEKLIKIKEKIRQLFENVSISSFSICDEALEYIRLQSIDIAFVYVDSNDLEKSLGEKCIEKIYLFSPSFKHLVVVGDAKETAKLAYDMNAIDYLLFPIETDRLLQTYQKIQTSYHAEKIENKKTDIHIQCFNGFKVFKKDKEVVFTASRAKELLAYLVTNRDRKLTWMQIADALWPDSPSDEKLMNNFHVASFALRKTLKKHNIMSLFGYSRNSYWVDTSKFTCDFYQLIDLYREFLKNDSLQIPVYTVPFGDFMDNTNYSWAFTIQNRIEKIYKDLAKDEQFKKVKYIYPETM